MTNKKRGFFTELPRVADPLQGVLTFDEGQKPASGPPSASRAVFGGARRGGKTAALDAHQIRRRETLELIRRELKILYLDRQIHHYPQDPFVTADDATFILRKLERDGKVPPDPARKNWKGALFTNGEWEFTGKWAPTVIAENNGRQQRCWRLIPGVPKP